MNSLVETNYEYIHATAEAKAVEIAKATGMFADVEDFRQDLIMALIAQAGSYNPDRATQRTFISVCLNNAKKDLLKRLFTNKRRANMYGEEINEEQHEAKQNVCRSIPEELKHLPERLQRICMDILCGMSITETARDQGITKRDVRQAIFNEVPECLENLQENIKRYYRA